MLSFLYSSVIILLWFNPSYMYYVDSKQSMATQYKEISTYHHLQDDDSGWWWCCRYMYINMHKSYTSSLCRYNKIKCVKLWKILYDVIQLWCWIQKFYFFILMCVESYFPLCFANGNDDYDEEEESRATRYFYCW